MNETKPNALEQRQLDQAMLDGHLDLSVQFRGGATKTLRLRLIRLSEVQPYLEASQIDQIACLRMVTTRLRRWGIPLALSEKANLWHRLRRLILCCSPWHNWLDRLTADSFERLLEVNKALNFTSARAWFEKTNARAIEDGIAVAEIAQANLGLLRTLSEKLPWLQEWARQSFGSSLSPSCDSTTSGSSDEKPAPSPASDSPSSPASDSPTA